MATENEEGKVRIFGVILAGGTAKRMGGADKALLNLAGTPLIGHVIARLAPQVEQMAISANGAAARFAQFGLPVLPDDASHGPLSGVLAALRWAAPLGASGVVTASVDTPFLPADLVPQLCLAAESSAEGLAFAVAAKDHPACALWPVALIAPLTAFLGSGVKPRVVTFAESHHAARAKFADEAAFQNLNTPEDLAAAHALLTGAA